METIPDIFDLKQTFIYMWKNILHAERSPPWTYATHILV